MKRRDFVLGMATVPFLRIGLTKAEEPGNRIIRVQGVSIPEERATEIVVEGIDANFNYVTETITVGR